MYHLWGCTSIYQPLSYPLRSLAWLSDFSRITKIPFIANSCKYWVWVQISQGTGRWQVLMVEKSEFNMLHLAATLIYGLELNLCMLLNEINIWYKSYSFSIKYLKIVVKSRKRERERERERERGDNVYYTSPQSFT